MTAVLCVLSRVWVFNELDMFVLAQERIALCVGLVATTIAPGDGDYAPF